MEKIRLLVISDTHIPYASKNLPKLVLDEISVADQIIHAGDYVDYKLMEELNKRGNFYGVHGNMDPGIIRKELPQSQIFYFENLKIAIIHGSGPPEGLEYRVFEFFKKNEPDIVIFGHSHIALNKFMGKTLVFNPGSPCDKRWTPYRSYGIIEIFPSRVASCKFDAKIVQLE